jgi:hypothetical protein
VLKIRTIEFFATPLDDRHGILKVGRPTLPSGESVIFINPPQIDYLCRQFSLQQRLGPDHTHAAELKFSVGEILLLV